jgi:hypothetical protein
MLVFDGLDGQGVVWELDFSEPATWTRLSSAGRAPEARTFQAGAFDPARHQFLVFGGQIPGTGGPGQLLNDLAALQFDVPTPTLLSIENTEVEPGVVRIVWRTSQGTHALVTVERADGPGEWKPRSTLVTDGTGRLRYEDRDVINGSRYGYRLRVDNGGGAIVRGEVWLDVPAGLALSLGAIAPNPASGPFSVTFTIPTAGAASFELWDVAGRRVFARTLEGLPGGVNQITLTEQRLRSGIYLLRLEHQGRTASTKITVISGDHR